MKSIPLILAAWMSLLCGWSASAQIDLDHPVLVGSADHVFRSVQDSNSMYFFPIALVRQGEVDIADSDRRTSRAIFQFGGDPTELSIIQSELKAQKISSETLRYFRPNQVTFQPGVDLPNPGSVAITSLNDFNFDGSSSIAIQVPSRKGLFRRTSTGVRLLNQLFTNGSNNNVVIVRYEFSAIFGGKPGIGQTSIAIFTDTHKSTPPERFEFKSQFLGSENNVLLNASNHCWDQTLPGKFCFQPAP